MSTYVKNYEFTAFCESDFGIGNVNVGDCFSMPAIATTCITVKDNDAFLSGDSRCNENSDDKSYQNAGIEKNGAEAGNGGQIYAESYYIVKDQYGNKYIMIEIEQEGTNDDFFTFFNGYGYGGTPPAGSELSVVQCCNVTSNWIDFKCLDAGPKELPNGWVKGRLTFDEDCNDNEWNSDTGTWDQGVAGKTVQLLDLDGNVVASTTTSANGSYMFDVPPGEYRVQFPELEGYQFSAKDSGVREHYDSDANANGLTDVITVVSGSTIKNIDAGIKEIPKGSIAGTVFCDLDCDGIQDVATTSTEYTLGSNLIINGDFEDNGLNNCGWGSGNLASWYNVGSVKAQIHEQNYGHGNAKGDAIVELECGVIICQEVKVQDEGCYLLSFDVTRRGSSDQDNTFTLFIDGVKYEQYTVSAASTIEIELDLTSGDHRFDFKSDSYTYKGAGLDDVKLQLKTPVMNDDEEPGKEGVTVNLVDADGNIVDTTTTDADGNYKFDDLDDGDYTVQVVAPAGQEFTLQDVGSDDSIDSDVNAAGTSGVITLSGGNDVTDVDAGLKDEKIEPGSLSGTYFCDDNRDGDDDGAGAGDADVAGKTVTLLNADGSVATDIDGNPVATVQTDSEGNYSFTNLAAGDYKVMFEDSSAEGKQFIAQNAGNDDTDDSDVDPANGMTGAVSVVAGEETKDVDAGVEAIPNEKPEPKDDAEDTCYFDAVSINVIANDMDPENDTLTVTAINGIAIAEGDLPIEIDGVFVTLVGGELVFDGSAANAGLLVGEENIENYTYTVSDGNGNEASANVEVTFCGATDTIAKVKEVIPTAVQFQLIDENNPAPSSDEAWTMQVTDATGVLSGTFAFAYCLSFFDTALAGQSGTDINNATLIDANVYVADQDCLPAGIDFGDIGLNGLDASENLDMINWIINQGFTSQDNGDGNGTTYSDNEIQAAIWGLTDGFIFVSNDGSSTELNANEIYDAAIANGEGFEANAANGGLVTVYFDPTGDNDPNNDHEQAFIAGIDLFEDCIC